MALRLSLPLGPPPAGVSPTVATQHLAKLSKGLSPESATFGADHVAKRYTLGATASTPAEFREVAMIWAGTVAIGATDRSVTVELEIPSRIELGAALPPGVPVPQRATYGPVLVRASTHGISYPPISGGRVGLGEAGAIIGELDGAEFWLALQDENGYYLDPDIYFRLFEAAGLWGLPASATNPFVPAANTSGGTVHVAGPSPLAQGQPYLKLHGGSGIGGLVIHNPPQELQVEYFSFLLSEPISVELVNKPAGATASLRIEDVSDPMYRTLASPRHVNIALGGPTSFVPQAVLKPHHDQWKSKGNDKPGKPLQYRLRAVLSGGAASWTTPNQTTISQDIKDVIRQEYLFHSVPFQDDKINLPIPPRGMLQRVYRSSDQWTEELQNHNYGKGNGGWLLNASEAFQVGRYVRRRFADRLKALRDADPPALPYWVGEDLHIKSAWRNPERNEWVPGSARLSNHQFGRALDLISPHGWSEALFTALFEAGSEFLDALISLNGTKACDKVEILLEQAGAAGGVLWKAEVVKSGTKWVKRVGFGGAYDTVVAVTPRSFKAATKKATHVHVGWSPAGGAPALALPPVPPDPPVPSAPMRNLVLYAAEKGTAAGDQIPVNHVARSIADYLGAIDPGTPTDTLEVGDPVDFLYRIGAHAGPLAYRVRRLFYVGHAYESGLILTDYPDGTPYEKPASGSATLWIHDADVATRLGELYGVSRKFGENDYTEFKTHQVRVSNLRLLPPFFKENLRWTLAKSEGIYLLGCRAADEIDLKETTFCQELANVSGRPVHAAAYYSKFFSSDAAGEWVPYHKTRSDPDPTDRQVILVPAQGIGSAFAFFKRHQVLKSVPDPLPTCDLIAVYEHILTRCDPETP